METEPTITSTSRKENVAFSEKERHIAILVQSKLELIEIVGSVRQQTLNLRKYRLQHTVSPIQHGSILTHEFNFNKSTLSLVGVEINASQQTLIMQRSSPTYGLSSSTWWLS